MPPPAALGLLLSSMCTGWEVMCLPRQVDQKNIDCCALLGSVPCAARVMGQRLRARPLACLAGLGFIWY